VTLQRCARAAGIACRGCEKEESGGFMRWDGWDGWDGWDEWDDWNE